MKHITANAELEVGQYYWCRDKRKPFPITLQQCQQSATGWKHVGDRMWAEEHNSQALTFWDIVGPVPTMDEQGFTAITKKP